MFRRPPSSTRTDTLLPHTALCRSPAARASPRERSMFAEENETILHASPPKVWAALTRFDDYPRWSPFVRISGQLEQGALVEYSFRMRSNKPRFWTVDARIRSEEHTSELQSLMRISYAVFCLKKKKQKNT